MSRQRKKGTLMETSVVEYLRKAFGDAEGTICRAAMHGASDEGDIHGLRHRGERIVIEVKNRRRYEPREWLEEAEIERGNADAGYGVVVFHLNGVGTARMGEQAVLMTLETFCKILGAENGHD